METAIGVFAARERAEEAVKSLLDQHVPKDSIVDLTRAMVTSAVSEIKTTRIARMATSAVPR